MAEGFKITVMIYILPSVVFFHIITNYQTNFFLNKLFIQCEKKRTYNLVQRQH